MDEIDDKLVMQKKRIDPLLATWVYSCLLASIYALVSLATSRDSEISMDLVLAVSSTSMRGSLSTRGTSDFFESSLRSRSSSSLSSDLLAAV